MRFFDEWKNPALKCERVGHIAETKQRRGFTWSGKYGCVADSVSQRRAVCRTCGKELSEWEDTHRSGLNGLSMPSEHMRILDEHGEFWK